MYELFVFGKVPKVASNSIQPYVSQSISPIIATLTLYTTIHKQKNRSILLTTYSRVFIKFNLKFNYSFLMSINNLI
jgi:hypothetical protein